MAIVDNELRSAVFWYGCHMARHGELVRTSQALSKWLAGRSRRWAGRATAAVIRGNPMLE
jgi:hypothetical protein